MSWTLNTGTLVNVNARRWINATLVGFSAYLVYFFLFRPGESEHRFRQKMFVIKCDQSPAWQPAINIHGTHTTHSYRTLLLWILLWYTARSMPVCRICLPSIVWLISNRKCTSVPLSRLGSRYSFAQNQIQQKIASTTNANSHVFSKFHEIHSLDTPLRFTRPPWIEQTK